MTYAELCVTSNFTFLTGASHPEELVLRAAELRLSAIAITDRNSLAGVVRAYSALKTLRDEAARTLRVRSSQQIDPSSRQVVGPPQALPMPVVPTLPKLVVGSRLVLRDCPVEWLALPTDRAAYQRLARLLTQGKRRAPKGECHLDLDDLEDGCRGMILIALPPRDFQQAFVPLHHLQRRYPGHVFLGAAPSYDGADQARFDTCAAMALRCSTPMVAVGDVLMHHGRRRKLADVLTCLREGITIDRIGMRALPNAERRLKGASDMAQLFRRHPAALKRTLEIAARCSFCLSELSY
ncbi:PHP domain-containing protein, partial [Rhodovulum adriaticum]